MKQVILITGASSGIGMSAAIKLHELGYTVYGAARSIDKMKPLKDIGINIINLDLTNRASTEQAVKHIIDNEGQIDALVNSAGYGFFGAVEDVSIDDARHQFDVNLFGLAHLTQLVLPYMRRAMRGRIINISSMAGRTHTPYGAWYHATKFAVEGFSDTLRLEVEYPFNIYVSIIEPGIIKTPWGDIAANNLIESSKNGAYRDSAKRIAEGLKKMYASNSISSVDAISNTIVKAIICKRPKTRYVVGYLARPLILLRRLLSDRCYDKVVRMVQKM